jgi:hypothetical protein
LLLEDLHEALGDNYWNNSMYSKYSALMNNVTWHIVLANQGRNIIGCKWVNKIKIKSHGTIDRYKA